MHFRKPCRIERRRVLNSWCVIERNELIQLNIAVNREAYVARLNN